jgi:hypothetical protein
MIRHQTLAIEKMIASCVGDCKCFNKLDQSRIDLRGGCGPRSPIMNFSRPRALHLGKMLRTRDGKQGAYAPIVELDMIGNKTDRLSDDDIWCRETCTARDPVKNMLRHQMHDPATRPL